MTLGWLRICLFVACVSSSAQELCRVFQFSGPVYAFLRIQGVEASLHDLDDEIESLLNEQPNITVVLAEIASRRSGMRHVSGSCLEPLNLSPPFLAGIDRNQGGQLAKKLIVIARIEPSRILVFEPESIEGWFWAPRKSIELFLTGDVVIRKDRWSSVFEIGFLFIIVATFLVTGLIIARSGVLRVSGKKKGANVLTLMILALTAGCDSGGGVDADSIQAIEDTVNLGRLIEGDDLDFSLAVTNRTRSTWHVIGHGVDCSACLMAVREIEGLEIGPNGVLDFKFKLTTAGQTGQRARSILIKFSNSTGSLIDIPFRVEYDVEPTPRIAPAIVSAKSVPGFEDRYQGQFAITHRQTCGEDATDFSFECPVELKFVRGDSKFLRPNASSEYHDIQVSFQVVGPPDLNPGVYPVKSISGNSTQATQFHVELSRMHPVQPDLERLLFMAPAAKESCSKTIFLENVLTETIGIQRCEFSGNAKIEIKWGNQESANLLRPGRNEVNIVVSARDRSTDREDIAGSVTFVFSDDRIPKLRIPIVWMN